MPVEMMGVVEIPTGKADVTAAIGIDFGGSLVKVAQVDKEKSNEKKTVINLSLFPNDELETCLKEVSQKWKEASKEAEAGNGGPIITTGLGGNTHQDIIQKILDSKTCNIMEFDGIFGSICFLNKHLAYSDLVHELPKEAIEEGLQMAKDQVKAYSTFPSLDGMASGTNVAWKVMCSPLVTEGKPVIPGGDKIAFPCLYVGVGSATARAKLYDNKTFRFWDAGHLALSGKALLALGKTLTGAKNFNELLALAEKGDNKGVDEYFSNVSPPNAGDWYGEACNMDIGLFSLGKMLGTNAENLKPEDKARSLLVIFISHLASHAFESAAMAGVNDIVFVGTPWYSPLLRKLLTTYMTYNINFKSAMHGRNYSQMRFHVLKSSGHMASIGCLLHSLGLDFHKCDDKKTPE